MSIDDDLNAAVETLRRLLDDKTLIEAAHEAAEICIASLRSGHKILFVGNGGSAAEAQHMAGEYVSRFAFDRPGLAALALTTDTSILTAISNDYGYEKVFSRQIEALGSPGDVLFAYSTSGASRNILAALKTAQEKGIDSIGMTGAKGEGMRAYCDVIIAVPSTVTPHIQECHTALGHAICGEVERTLFSRNL